MTIVAEPSSGRDQVGLPSPPELRPAPALLSRLSRTAFRYGNRFLAVPFHRAGLAAWLGNPLTGCQLLLTTTGHRTGLPRDTPLGYVVAEGSAWVLAGYGPSTLWYRNLLADPQVVVRLPARGWLEGVADAVHDPATRARIVPLLVRSMPLPGWSIGTNVWTATDQRILDLVAWVPLVRLRSLDGPLVAGPDDPGGRAWIWRQAVVSCGILAGATLVRRAASRARAGRPRR